MNNCKFTDNYKIAISEEEAKLMSPSEVPYNSKYRWNFYQIDRNLYRLNGGLDWSDKYETSHCNLG